jgi:hypothetical protein
MKINKYMQSTIAGLGMLVLISGCAASGKVINSDAVRIIPDKKYEKIIILRLPEGEPTEPNAGFVYVLPKGKISTDFPREEFVENLNGLLENAQTSRIYHMGKFVIKDSEGKVRGYYEMLPNYTVILWERKDDILLQVVIPDSPPDHNGIEFGGRRGGRSGR